MKSSAAKQVHQDPLTRPCVMQVVLSLTPGGAERLVVDVVKRLTPDFRMVVCCLDEPGEWAGEVTEIGVPVVALHRVPGFHPSLGRRIAALAAEHHASVLHCHQYSPFVYGRIATLLKPSLGLVFTEHGRLSDAPPSAKRTIANAMFSRFSGAVVAVSEDLKTYMVAEGFQEGRVDVIHNGIDPGVRPTSSDRNTARRLLGLADGAFVVGTAARLDAVKDLPTLVQAVGVVASRRPGVELVIVGDGEERRAIEAAASAAGCADRVHLVGYRPDVRRLLPAFDVYANSSISEGISLTILEAMAAGVPVVATRVGGTPEVILDGLTGLLVESRSVAEMASAVGLLASEPGRRQQLASAGRIRVEECFGLDRMVASYAREYLRQGRA